MSYDAAGGSDHESRVAQCVNAVRKLGRRGRIPGGGVHRRGPSSPPCPPGIKGDNAKLRREVLSSASLFGCTGGAKIHKEEAPYGQQEALKCENHPLCSGAPWHPQSRWHAVWSLAHPPHRDRSAETRLANSSECAVERNADRFPVRDGMRHHRYRVGPTLWRKRAGVRFAYDLKHLGAVPLDQEIENGGVD